MSNYVSRHTSKADLEALRKTNPAKIKYPGGTCQVCGEKCSKIVSECDACFENRRIRIPGRFSSD